jgi:hypothetical protein
VKPVIIGLAEQKNKLSELVDRVGQGEEITITRHANAHHFDAILDVVLLYLKAGFPVFTLSVSAYPNRGSELRHVGPLPTPR